jgi:hypothetical protein
MTRAAMRRSTTVRPLVAVNGRFLADELELLSRCCPPLRQPERPLKWEEQSFPL